MHTFSIFEHLLTLNASPPEKAHSGIRYFYPGLHLSPFIEIPVLISILGER
ncbi:hypothetical protein M2133_003024 [Parabacteroides sp. PF5-6]|nr:hypothetical protein [Parabacteroides sp. PF5-6]